MDALGLDRGEALDLMGVSSYLTFEIMIPFILSEWQHVTIETVGMYGV